MAITLDSLKNGETAIVLSLRPEGRTMRRLIEMGVTPGTKIRVVRRAPLGDPIEIDLRGYHLALRADDAHRIFVREAHT